jgi:hypothetical protein
VLSVDLVSVLSVLSVDLVSVLSVLSVDLVWGKIFWVKTTESVGAIAVFGANLPVLDDQLGGKGI